VTILPDSVVVIGAGLAGLRTAERLRQSGFGGSITLVGREQDLPYDRPPLSKQLLQESWAPEHTLLTSLHALQELGVDVRLGVSAVSLDKRRIGLDDGTELHPDAVVIATGVVPRVLPGQPAGVSTLRTLTHARDLREALSSAKSLLVIGAGFIGAEITTAARAASVEVTVLEAESQPCARVLGEQGGALVARLFREAGVDLRTGSSVKQFVDARTVELADGEKLTADHILVSVGAVPDTEWLEGAVPLMPGGGGIITGSTGRIEPLPCVWALGDVAAWWDQPRRRNARAEHWTSAGDQASAVVADMLGLETPTPPVPYVWSDQFGLKLQVIGRPDLADRIETLKGEGTSGGTVKGTVLGYRKGDALVGVAAFGAPAALLGYREPVAAGTASITTVAVPDDDE
jgi:NADPH-dependent 2,4-dienoyl-CoA reductase/sulfur reductase-like enzyme